MARLIDSSVYLGIVRLLRTGQDCEAALGGLFCHQEGFEFSDGIRMAINQPTGDRGNQGAYVREVNGGTVQFFVFHASFQCDSRAMPLDGVTCEGEAPEGV